MSIPQIETANGPSAAYRAQVGQLFPVVCGNRVFNYNITEYFLVTSLRNLDHPISGRLVRFVNNPAL